MFVFDPNPKQRQILARFLNISTHRRGTIPSPHKPLLLIWTISKYIRDSLDPSLPNHRLLPFCYYKDTIGKKIQSFSLFQAKIKIEYPYWYLRFDDVWEWDPSTTIIRNNAYKPAMESYHASSAGLLEGDYNEIINNPRFGSALIYSLLDKFFPETLHGDILEAADFPIDQLPIKREEDLQPEETTERKIRNHRFRTEVLRAYDKQCAVCRHSVWISDLGNSQPIALEAAHIQWHGMNGPDIVSNGLALCSTHHSLFDRGAYTLMHADSDKYLMKVSKKIHVRTFDNWLVQYNDSELHLPNDKEHQPNQNFVRWHNENIFKG